MLPKHKPKAVWLSIIMVFGLVSMFIGPRMNMKTAVSTYKAITDKCFHLIVEFTCKILRKKQFYNENKVDR